ncbi:radical SAM protein [Kitasatospora sp. NPDC058218]|uniref:radical SAM protein n=1 Tax=Kitasatospora sp. NPDC058218 TaxID=3346385 RepID=UPI0036DED55E
MHDVIAASFVGGYVVLRPDRLQSIKIPESKFRELEHGSTTGGACPAWLVDAADRRWGVALPSRQISDAVLIRQAPPYGHSRASWELNKGCDYDCEHCYLGEKKFAGLANKDKLRMLHTLRDAGVLWLQLTGGEPLIDPGFIPSYELAHELGMMVEILSNGSRLGNAKILDALTTRRPYRISLSVYGATPETYDGLTRRRGSFKRFSNGLTAGIEAGLPLELSLIITSRSAHEQQRMRDWAGELGLPYKEYAHMSPTIDGGAESLPSQSVEHLTTREPFKGCNAGHTFLHVDPHGLASICKVGRDEQINLMTEGARGLSRLGAIADRLMLRTGGCTGCLLSEKCSVCRPLAQRYQEAKAPLRSYCQHGQKGSAA